VRRRILSIMVAVFAAISIAVFTDLADATPNSAASTANAASSFNRLQRHSLAQIIEHGQEMAKVGPLASGASPWYAAVITAYSGGGCMGYSYVGGRLSPIQSALCNGDAEDDTDVEVRDVTGNSWNVGDSIEIIENALLGNALAFGYSGGEFKLETPSLPTTEFEIYSYNTTYYNESWLLLYQGADVFPAPNGDDEDLKVLTAAEYPADGWVPCGYYVSQCNPNNGGFLAFNG
jgi:hypothetical protein